MKKYITTPVIIILVLLAVGGFATYKLLNKADSTPNTPASSTPAEAEQREAEEHKDEIAKEEEAKKDPPQANKTVDVIITDASQYGQEVEVRAFIPKHLQEGNCLITFTQGARKITKEMPAHVDATSTICTNPVIKRSEFPMGGDWKVTVAYSAEGASGISDSQIIKLQ